MKYFYSIILSSIALTKISFSEGFKIFDAANSTLKETIKLPCGTLLHSNAWSDGGNFLTINTARLYTNRNNDLTLGLALDGKEPSQTTINIKSWNLSLHPNLKLDFESMTDPLYITINLKEGGNMHYYQSPSRTEKRYILNSNNLSPILDLRPLIEVTADNTLEFNWSMVSHINLKFCSSKPEAFKLKTIELLADTDIQDKAQVLIPQIQPLPTPQIQPLPTSGSPTAQGAGYSPSRQAIIDTSTQNVAYTGQDSAEVSTDEAVPEPFSILTLGTGITAFIRKRKQKDKNR